MTTPPGPPAGQLRRRQVLRTLPGAAAAAWLAACADLAAPAAAPIVTAGAPDGRGASVPAALDAALQLPSPPREFRAAWVATVANIDWPSKPGLSADAQRAEATVLLDRARAIGLNALILQVRPAADAIYPSTLEPWSESLSGRQGRGPGLPGEPAYDPLAFWVREAHRRGLELHAWFNPYRARHSTATSPLAPAHVALRQPGLVKAYGDQLWMDPGEPGAAVHTLAVVADVVRRYDIDGVHIDDYFYPYPIPAIATAPTGPELSFPDDNAYARYRLADGPLSRDDWRRANVDGLVQALQRTVHDIKPWLRVGISPFGIGRPDRRPPGISGFSQFDKLYADVERWLDNGWLDYLAPQLYWPIAREGQQFAVLLDYWIGQNRQQRHLWPGLFTSQVARNWPARELTDQVALLRTRPAAGGHIHFSMAALLQDRDGLAALLQQGPYVQPALVPATPWLGGGVAPPAPRLHKAGPRVAIEPAAGPAATAAARWVLWRRAAQQWRLDVLPPHERVIEPAGAATVAVCAVDRVGQLSEPALIQLS